MELLRNLFLGNAGIIGWQWLQIIIVVAYYAIPILLIYSLYKGRDIPFQWMFLVFGAFFIACGTPYVIDTWKEWFPEIYLLSDGMKAFTLMVAGTTTLLLITLTPFALALPSPAKLEAANLALANEIIQRQQAEEALSQFTSELEIRVKERTKKLRSVNASLRQEIRKRCKIEKELRQSETQLKLQTAQLEKALQKLQQAQAQLVQNEKMSALGQLVAGIGHEINNPVNFIHGNINYLKKYAQDLLNLLQLYQKCYPDPASEIQFEIEDIDLGFVKEDLPKLLSSMEMGTQRIRSIIISMQNFSRLDQVEMRAVDIHEGLDSTLLILQHRIKANGKNPGIQINKDYGDLPLVECYGGQMNQVFMNILANAIDALEDYNSKRSAQEINSCPSTIYICTKVLNQNSLVICITDNGPGMSQEVRQKLFDPFFTTKPVGKGTGLGLSISYQIVVEQHRGQLHCKTAPGQGTEFVIEIPLQSQLPSCPRTTATQDPINV